MTALRFNIDHVIVCDDIRTESSGKTILIGIYTGAIQPIQIPTKLKLAFWMLGKLEGKGSFKLALKITFTPDDGSKPFEIKSDQPMEGEVLDTFGEGSQMFQLAVPIEHLFEFSGAGVLTMSVKTDPGKDEFVEVMRKLVVPVTTSSSATPQPS